MHSALLFTVFTVFVPCTVAQLCPYNSYSSTGNQPCTSCEEGRYTTKIGQVFTGTKKQLHTTFTNSICIKCPSGKYKLFDATTTCLNCPAQTPFSIVGSNIDKCMNKDYYCGGYCESGWNCSLTFLSVSVSYNSIYDCDVPNGAGLPDSVSRASAPGARTYPCPPETMGCGTHSLDQIGYQRDSGLLPDGSNWNGPPYGKRECDYCYPCREGFTTTSPSGVQMGPGAQSCDYCLPGYGPRQSNAPGGCTIATPCGMCHKCPKGKYSNTITDHGVSCKSCGSRATTASIGSKSFNDCYCEQTGYFVWTTDVINGITCYQAEQCWYGQTCPTGIQCYRNYDVLGRYPESNISAWRGMKPPWPGQDGCLICSEGKYKSTLGSGPCTTCPVGKTIISSRGVLSYDSWSVLHDALWRCTNCAAGKYSAVQTDGICFNCPVYSTSPEGSSAVTQCTCNSGYSTDTSTTPFTCKPPPCAAGSTGPADSCTLCIAGKYKAVTGSAPCDNCAAGKFSTATGQSSSGTCQNCLAGKYASLTGSSVCANCFAGTYATLTGSTVCDNCAAGKFSAATGQSSSVTCQNCLSGKYSNTTGQSSSETCQNCAAGKFSALTGQSSSATCQNCDAGKFSTATGQSSSATCQNCQAGTYGNLTGSTACTLCPVLTTSAAGSSIVTQCTCDSGYVGPNGGPCIACVLGTCLNTSCQDCLAGTYARLTGSSVCENCLAGKYSTATGQSSSGTCQNCSAGKFSDKVGQNSSATCENCVAGKYSIATGQSSSDTCQNCLPGTYSNLTGITACTLCPNNTYASSVGRISCDACPGNSTSVAGSSQNTSCQCNRGYSGPNAGPCDACSAGFYKNTIGSASCSVCPTNSFSENASTAMTSCKCSRGYSGPDGGPCNACNAGFYKNTIGSGVCIACPTNSVSSVASDAVTNCKCNRGYSGADGTQCSACSAQFYKDTIGSENCTECPTTTVSNIASTALTNCSCTVGYSGPDGSVCAMCQAGFYKNTIGSAGCTACPANTISENASTALTSCKCNRGFSGADGGQCHACLPTFYKNTTGSASCSACPVHSVSDFASTTLLSCQCNKGYNGPDGGPCYACEAQFYKDTIGSANCSACAVNSVSPVASTAVQNCKCDSGYSGLDGGLCTECAAGTYKPAIGSQACTLCEANKYGIALAAISNTSCLACPGNSTSVRGSDKPELCFCVAGFEQTHAFDACIECRPGFYDNMTNRHECSSCSGGLFSAFWGATGVETCKECGAGTWSDIGSPTCQLCPALSNSSVKSRFLTDCKCLPGATGEDGQTCELCEAGTYKKGSGNGTCQACSENSFSVRGSSSCPCNAGYTGPDDGYCAECAQGTYKNVTGSAACRSCFLNSDSVPASTSKSSCLCKENYESTGEDNCTACGSGTTKLFGPGKCLGCTEFMAVGDGSCQCNAGYRIVDKGCKACDVGSFKNIFGNTSLATQECELVEKFSPERGFINPSCCKCRQNRTTLTVGANHSSDCLCQAGFGGSECNACSIGKYKTNVSMHECLSCPAGATTLQYASAAESDCVAAPGHFGNGTAGFAPCAAGSYAPSPAMQTCLLCAAGATGPVGAQSNAECGCNQLGFKQIDHVKTYTITVSQFAFHVDGERRPVLKLYTPGVYSFVQSDPSNDGHQLAFRDMNGNKYNTGVMFQGIPGSTGARTILTISNTDTRMLRYYCIVHGNFMGSTMTMTDEVICTCEAGYARTSSTGVCPLCPRNYYCPGGDLPAQSCPNASLSLEGRTAQTDCVCGPGYSGPNGGPCIACANGEWKAVNGSSPCIKCAPNTTSPTASTEAKACVCKPGFSGPDGGLCVACDVGTYKQSAGAFPCSNCSANTTTRERGSDEYADCLCERGLEFVGFSAATNMSICAACAQGKYKEAPGHPQVCVSCPAHTTTVGLGAIVPSACVCVPGRYRVLSAQNVSSCAQCPANTFKSSEGNSACTLCAANASAPTGSAAMTACLCLPGFTGVNGGPCAPCARGEYKSVNGSSACVKCANNTMSPGASSKMTDCLCIGGYVGLPGGPCSMCPKATYTHNGTCVSCPANSDSDAASTSISACKCKPGYSGPSGGPCSPCGAGFYRSNADPQCVKCPDNTNTKSAVAQSVAECQGIAGFTNIEVKAPWVRISIKIYDDEYQRYSLGTVQTNFQRAVAAAARKVCDCNVTQDDISILDSVPGTGGAATRRLMQAFIELTLAIKVPTALDGQEVLNLMLLSDLTSALQAEGESVSISDIAKVLITENVVFSTPCPPNTYKTELGDFACLPCPAQSISPAASTSIDACKCRANLIQKSDRSCDRVCAAGFEARTGSNAQTACAPCRASYYKTAAGEQDCTRCPPNAFSQLTAQTSIVACMCEQGYVWNSMTQLCDACPAGTFNNEYNENVCYQCNTTCQT
jgi:hypothetical protein